MTPNPKLTVNQVIEYGIRLAQDDPASARKFFEKALEREPDNVTALLWLAGLAETGEESLRFAARVLEIDPKNERAKAAIRWARKRVRAGAATTDRAMGVPAVVGEPSTSASTSEVAPANHNRPASLVLGIVALILLCGGIFATTWLLSQPGVATAAIAQVTATFTPIPTATDTPTPTPTLTPTATPTAMPTATPTLTPTPTDTPAPTDTPLPEPTATPDVPDPQSAASNGDKWIDVNLTTQSLVAYEGDKPVYWVTVSTGLPGTPTVTGQYHIYVKYVSQLMYGPGYYLPDVPYVMYFYLGYGIHGTYWHNNFGHPMSHGCVNTPTPDAKWLYEWAPIGTLVNVHY